VGVRVVTPDRPGYGGSTPLAGRTTASWVADTAALADRVGVERFGVMALSSGGPYTVACAAPLPDRVCGGGVAAGNTDMSWPDARTWYLESELTIMGLDDEDVATACCAEQYGAAGSRFFEGEMDLGATDNAWLADPENATALFTTMGEASRQGVTGYAHDITVPCRPWTFDPGSIAVPVIASRAAPISSSRSATAATRRR